MNGSPTPVSAGLSRSSLVATRRADNAGRRASAAPGGRPRLHLYRALASATGPSRRRRRSLAALPAWAMGPAATGGGRLVPVPADPRYAAHPRVTQGVPVPVGRRFERRSTTCPPPGCSHYTVADSDETRPDRAAVSRPSSRIRRQRVERRRKGNRPSPRPPATDDARGACGISIHCEHAAIRRLRKAARNLTMRTTHIGHRLRGKGAAGATVGPGTRRSGSAASPPPSPPTVRQSGRNPVAAALQRQRRPRSSRLRPEHLRQHRSPRHLPAVPMPATELRCDDAGRGVPARRMRLLPGGGRRPKGLTPTGDARGTPRRTGPRLRSDGFERGVRQAGLEPGTLRRGAWFDCRVPRATGPPPEAKGWHSSVTHPGRSDRGDRIDTGKGEDTDSAAGSRGAVDGDRRAPGALARS